MLSLPDFATRLAEPSGFVEDAAAGGGVVAVVDLRTAPPVALLDAARAAVRTVPGVIIGVAPTEPSPETGTWTELIDVVLEGFSGEDRVASRSLWAWEHLGVAVGVDLDGHLERLVTSIAARPQAAAALALLLRNRHTGTEGGLVTESATYSMLQSGPEFGAWLAARPERRPPSGETTPVTVDRDGDRLLVTLSRPARHNALNTAMRDALAEALTLALADPAATVVLKGDGPSFCSGGDLDDFGSAPDPATAHLVRLTRSPAALAARLGPRLEAHVHGACIGAGIELAAFAGTVVAHPDTFFALPELSLGLIPGSGGTVSLTQRIRRHRTAWLALSGERIDARRALAWGLIDEIRTD